MIRTHEVPDSNLFNQQISLTVSMVSSNFSHKSNAVVKTNILQCLYIKCHKLQFFLFRCKDINFNPQL